MINPIIWRIESTQCSYYDTESLTTLEMVGKLVDKINSDINAYNNLENKTEDYYKKFTKDITNYKAQIEKLLKENNNEIIEFKDEFMELLNSINNINETIEYINRQSDEVQELAEKNKQAIESASVPTKADLTNLNNTLTQAINENKNIFNTEISTLKNNYLSYSVKSFKNENGSYVKGDGIQDDTTGIQNALNQVISTGGKLYFPTGTYLVTAPIVGDTSNRGKKIIIEGNGLGTSIIKNNHSGNCIELSGYLYEINDLYILNTYSVNEGCGLKLSPGGRRKLKNLQVQAFKTGIYQNGGFDMFSMENVLCCDNTNVGFYMNVNDVKSCALLSVRDCLFNTNKSHGFEVNQTNGQLINLIIENTEFINNDGHGAYLHSEYGAPICSITFKNCDIEHIKTTYSGIYLKNVYKFSIEESAFNAVSETSKGVIYLENCKDGFIKNQWFSDNIDINKLIVIDKYCDSIYLMGNRIGYSKKADFYSEGEIPPTCINFDNLYKTLYKPIFLSENNNVDGLTVNRLNGKYALVCPSGVQSHIVYTHDSSLNKNKIKFLNVKWYNLNSEYQGKKVVFTAYNQSSENSKVYCSSTTEVTNAMEINTTRIVIKPIPFDRSDLTSIYVLRNGTDNNDTLIGDICILGFTISYE